MEKRYMTYNGEGGEVGYLTMAEAEARYEDVVYEQDSGTISVGERMSTPEIAAELQDLDDGTGDLGIIIRQALRDDPTATAAEIREIVLEARAEHQANLAAE